MDPARRALQDALGSVSPRTTRLASGHTGDVLRIEPDVGPPLVAKLDPGGVGGLEIEAECLRRMRAVGAPVPRVEHASSHLLLMEWCAGTTGVQEAAAEDAARGLHKLHCAGSGPFGFPFDTRIGGLVQPNDPTESWLAFFAVHRLVAFARAAGEEGTLDAEGVRLVEAVAARLPDLLPEPVAPALLHGDLWAGNVLTEGGRLTAFLDPALYHGHPEVDLAFATMFGGFPRRFFDAYRELAAPSDETMLDRGFWSERRSLWNLYPLLVHVRLFGGGAAEELLRTARAFA